MLTRFAPKPLKEETDWLRLAWFSVDVLELFVLILILCALTR